jgi:hypothetical protein
MNNPALRRLPPGVFLVLILGTVYWIWFRLYTGIVLEDGFITFRYARNLALGRGFVFNEGEKVLGTTAPLLTMILALLGRVWNVDAIPVFSAALGMFLGVLTAILTYAILVKLGCSRFAGGLSMVIYFSSARFVITTIGGMETPLVLFLMALSLYFFLFGQYTASLVASSFLLLARVDGLFWAAGMLVAVLMKQRRLPAKSIPACGAVLVPWVVFATTYFGSLVPHSVLAKDAIRFYPPLPVAPLAAARDFLRWYSDPSGFGMPGPLFVLCAGLVCAGAFKAIRERSTRTAGILLLTFSGVFALFLHGVGVPHGEWYPMPALWTNLLLCVAGIEAIVVMLAERIQTEPRKNVFRLAVFACVAVLYCTWQISLPALEWRYKWQVNEIAVQKALGLWLCENTLPNSVFATEAIGYQGFYSRRRVIDFAGLVSPEVVALRRESHSNAEMFQKILSRLRPDYLVLRRFEVEENRNFFGGPLFEKPEHRASFLARYREVKSFDPPFREVWGQIWELRVYQFVTPEGEQAGAGSPR